jgi:AraC-like DNA-binding protein
MSSFYTNDVDEFNQYAAGWSVQYHVLDATAFRSRLSLVATSSLQVALVQHAMAYSAQGENPTGVFSMVTTVDEARPLVHDGRTLEPREMALIRSGKGYACVNRRAAPFLAVSVAAEKMERYAADMWHRSNLGSQSADRIRFVDSAHRSRYVDACERILCAVNEQPGVLSEQHAAAVLEEKLLECLFVNAQLTSSPARERWRHISARQAYSDLHGRAHEAPSVREMCASTGASYATLERGFLETYGMTPKAMMLALRLSGARRTLLDPTPTTTVTAVALQWGFVELGRFSVRYRQRYGEVPSETLRRVRGERPPPSRSRAPGQARAHAGESPPDEDGGAACTATATDRGRRGSLRLPEEG